MGKAGKKNTQLPPTIELRPQPYLTLKPSLVEDEDGFPVVNDKTKGPRLSGKEWVPIAYRRRADELHPDLVNITTASSQTRHGIRDCRRLCQAAGSALYRKGAAQAQHLAQEAERLAQTAPE